MMVNSFCAKMVWMMLGFSASLLLNSRIRTPGPVEVVQLLLFGRTSFSADKKIIFHFYKKEVINKSSSVTFELVRLIILSYNR